MGSARRHRSRPGRRRSTAIGLNPHWHAEQPEHKPAWAFVSAAVNLSSQTELKEARHGQTHRFRDREQSGNRAGLRRDRRHQDTRDWYRHAGREEYSCTDADDTQ